MDNRKKRLADDSPSPVPAEGAEVFRPARDDTRAAAYFVGRSIETGERALFRVRWPAQTTRRQTGQAEEVPREVIHLKDRKRSSSPMKPDPYLEAEERARKRSAGEG